MRAPVRRSLLRHITWFGGDRRIVGGSLLFLIPLGFTMFTAYGFFFGIPIVFPLVVFMAVIWVSREMYKSDPYKLDIWWRNKGYHKHYAAKASIGAAQRSIKDYY